VAGRRKVMRPIEGELGTSLTCADVELDKLGGAPSYHHNNSSEFKLDNLESK
jgi:hypothetical protein